MSVRDTEQWAFEILREHLLGRGHRIANVRRPDAQNRSSRDVDFLIEFDGRDVAVEVTQLDQERQWWVLLRRLENAIRAGLLTRRDNTLGVVVWLRLLRTASYRDIDLAAAQIVDAIDRLAENLATDWKSLEGLSATTGGLVDVEVRRRDSIGIGFISGNEAHDSWLGPRAAAFVRHLLESKRSQAAQYAEVWVLAIDNDVLIDVDALAEAFAEPDIRTPPNWTRLYMLPASNRTDVKLLNLA